MRRLTVGFVVTGTLLVACRSVLGIDDGVPTLDRADGSESDAQNADGNVTADGAARTDAPASSDANANDARTADAADAHVGDAGPPLEGGFCVVNPGHTQCEDFDTPGLASRWDAVNNVTVVSGETTSDPNAMLASATAAKDTILTAPAVISKSFPAATHIKIRVAVRIDVNSNATPEFIRVTMTPPPPGFGRYFLAVGPDLGFPPDLIYSIVSDAGITFDRASTNQDFTTAFRVIVVDIDQPTSKISATVDGVAAGSLSIPPFAPAPTTITFGVTTLDNAGNGSATTFTTRIDDLLIDITP